VWNFNWSGVYVEGQALIKTREFSKYPDFFGTFEGFLFHLLLFLMVS
jgi:hypothetical protein